MPISFEDAVRNLQRNEKLTRSGAIQRLIKAREWGDPLVKEISGLEEGISYEEEGIIPREERYVRQVVSSAGKPFAYGPYLAGYKGPYEALEQFPEERLPNTVADIAGEAVGSTIPFAAAEAAIAPRIARYMAKGMMGAPLSIPAAARAGRLADIGAAGIAGAAVSPAYDPEHPLQAAAIGAGAGVGFGIAGRALGRGYDSIVSRLFRRPISELRGNQAVEDGLRMLGKAFHADKETMALRYQHLGEMQAALAKANLPPIDIVSTLTPEDKAAIFSGPQGSQMKPFHGPPEFTGPPVGPMTAQQYQEKMSPFFRGVGQPMEPNAGPPAPERAYGPFGGQVVTPDVEAPVGPLQQMQRNPLYEHNVAGAQYAPGQYAPFPEGPNPFKGLGYQAGDPTMFGPGEKPKRPKGMSAADRKRNDIFMDKAFRDEPTSQLQDFADPDLGDQFLEEDMARAKLDRGIAQEREFAAKRSPFVGPPPPPSDKPVLYVYTKDSKMSAGEYTSYDELLTAHGVDQKEVAKYGYNIRGHLEEFDDKKVATAAVRSALGEDIRPPKIKPAVVETDKPSLNDPRVLNLKVEGETYHGNAKTETYESIAKDNKLDLTKPAKYGFSTGKSSHWYDTEPEAANAMVRFKALGKREPTKAMELFEEQPPATLEGEAEAIVNAPKTGLLTKYNQADLVQEAVNTGAYDKIRSLFFSGASREGILKEISRGKVSPARAPEMVRAVIGEATSLKPHPAPPGVPMSQSHVIGEKLNFPLAGGRGRADGTIVAFQRNALTGIENAIVETENGVAHWVTPYDDIQVQKLKKKSWAQDPKKKASIDVAEKEQMKRGSARLQEQAAATEQVLPPQVQGDPVLQKKMQEVIDLVESNKAELAKTRSKVKGQYDEMVKSRPGAKKTKLKKC